MKYDINKKGPATKSSITVSGQRTSTTIERKSVSLDDEDDDDEL
jgi:hypothetical protein